MYYCSCQMSQWMSYVSVRGQHEDVMSESEAKVRILCDCQRQCQRPQWGFWVSYIRWRYKVTVTKHREDIMWVPVVTFKLCVRGHSEGIMYLSEANSGYYGYVRCQSECIILVSEVTVSILCQWQVKWGYFVSVRGHSEDILWM